MSKRTRIAIAGSAFVASVLAVGAATASASPDAAAGTDDQVTLRFDVQTSPFSYTDLGAPGPSAADVIVFHDTLLRNGRKVGHEVGSCTVVEASGLSNCTAVVTLTGQGTISYAFENAPPPKKVFAITGGSGRYRTAHGDGVFVESGHETATLTLTVIRD
jgi:Allene oxide cyclase barrel like domain